MIVLQAPHPLIQTTTLLPNPKLQDTESPAVTISLRRAMDGTPYTKVKSNARSRLSYVFSLTYEKALEVEAFIEAYFAKDIRLTDHKGQVWAVKIMTTPVELVPNAAGETTEVKLDFEGVKL